MLYCFCEVCLSMSRIITACVIITTFYSQSFHHHQKKPWTQQQLLSISTYPLSLCKQVFVSIDLSILEISHTQKKWSQTSCLLWLVSFSKHSVDLKFVCIVACYQYFIPFHYKIICHCMTRLRFIYLLISWLAFVFWGILINKVVSIHVHVFAWTHVFMPRSRISGFNIWGSAKPFSRVALPFSALPGLNQCPVSAHLH